MNSLSFNKDTFMENIENQTTKHRSTKIFEKVAINTLKRFDKGLLILTMPNGELVKIGDGRGINADIQINNPALFKKFVLSGDVGFGESYMDGDWSSSDLTTFFRWVIQNIENSGIMSGSKVKDLTINLLGQANKLTHIFNRNSKDGSKENISYHYDLSNDFYELMLDETMMYSCAIFKGNDTLKDAQIRKLNTICDDLDIKPNDHILEIGCGWGGFAVHAVKKYGCKVTGVTISKEQYIFAVERVKKLGLEDKITILLRDYRDLKGQFDKIVSIEMIEAVGDEFLPEYFETIHRLLKKEGVAVIQAITSPDSRYDSFKKGVDFIQKHIFPGSLLPSIRRMTESCKKTDLHLYNLRDIGPHYAKTLRLWKNRVEENESKIKELGMDQRFLRKWKYYLCYCEAAFMERNISDVHLTLIRPNNISYKSSLN